MAASPSCFHAVTEKFMKGIKTAVKTDWKNYAHMLTGNSRYFRADKAIFVANLDIATGEKFWISYHIKWKVQSFKNGNSDWIFQNYNQWMVFGSLASLEGDKDVCVGPVVMYDTTIGGNTNSQLIYSAFVNNKSTVIGTDGYVEITNFMCSKGDKPMPYIDSDELKAEGGAISKALIVALGLSEERRVA